MRAQGSAFEQIAKEYLQNHKLRYICENFTCKVGEIDLIMSHDNSLIFVEVKQRANNHYGGALAAVTIKKQQRIIKSAMFYCQQQNINFEQQACRFDVVAITGTSAPYEIEWVKSAFPD